MMVVREDGFIGITSESEISFGTVKRRALTPLHSTEIDKSSKGTTFGSSSGVKGKEVDVIIGGNFQTNDSMSIGLG